MVAWANWKYSSPLLDPFCGSGTIPIEAAMMARNIAPGLMRHFRIESLISHNKELFADVKTEAKGKAYPSGKYTIIGRDRDSEMIRIALGNALRAGVQDDIVFEVGDYLDSQTGEATIVSNPPYGNRLQ
jgi:23S rRNA G2445 N2-methylase RlmL